MFFSLLNPIIIPEKLILRNENTIGFSKIKFIYFTHYKRYIYTTKITIQLMITNGFLKLLNRLHTVSRNMKNHRFDQSRSLVAYPL